MQRVLLLMVLYGAMGTVALGGQILHVDGPSPSFEVATIKPWKPRPQPLHGDVPRRIDPARHVRSLVSDRVHFIGQVDLFIMEAYHLPMGSEKRILKAPGWVVDEADRYEVEAKIDAVTFAALQKMTAQQQSTQVALMKQVLLAERFHLKVHFETRGETSAYALVIAKGGVKMSRSKDGEGAGLSLQKNEMTAQAVTLDEFARSPLWTPIGNRFVVNETGLSGLFDFRLRWRTDTFEESSEQGGKDLPYLFEALEEQLGLKMVDTKTPLEVIVIDHIERPSAN